MSPSPPLHASTIRNNACRYRPDHHDASLMLVFDACESFLALRPEAHKNKRNGPTSQRPKVSLSLKDCISVTAVIEYMISVYGGDKRVRYKKRHLPIAPRYNKPLSLSAGPSVGRNTTREFF